MQVRTTKFQFSHGKQPRGWGMWGFFFDGNEDEHFWFTGSFAEAKRRAVEFARQWKHRTVEVAP